MIKEVISKPIPNLKESDIWRFWSKVTLLANPYKCWNWTATNTRGYGRICIVPEKNHEVSVTATRLAYFLHYNVDPIGWAVLHKCDNPSCCNPHHLFLGTNKENTDDMHKKKRANPPKGDDHWQKKLTAEDVLYIRAQQASGVTQKELARIFNVHQSAVSLIISRKSWSHI